MVDYRVLLVGCVKRNASPHAVHGLSYGAAKRTAFMHRLNKLWCLSHTLQKSQPSMCRYIFCYPLEMPNLTNFIIQIPIIGGCCDRYPQIKMVIQGFF
jgi:hypothetical protein